MPAFAILIPVGSGAVQIARLIDLLDAVRIYEGRADYRVYLVDDGADLGSALTRLPGGERCRIVLNPRKGRGNGWAGGTAVGTLTGLKRIWDSGERYDFVLRVDTDALVIAPFADRIRRIFRDLPAAGVIGSVRYVREPEQVLRDTAQMAKAVDKLARRITVWRRTPIGLPFFQASVFPGSRQIRNVIQRARSCGHRVGEQCCAGGLALPARTLEAFATRGFLRRPLNWLRTPLCDDFVLGLMIKACGLQIRDCSDPGQPFAVRHQGLPDCPERLADAGYAIIHSLKDRNDLKEESVRDFFRRRRHS